MELTDQQQAFVESEADQKAFIGGRQVGQTTGLVVDALQRARAGDAVAISAPQVGMGWMIMDRIAEIERDADIHHRNGKLERIVIETDTGTGSIDHRPLQRFDPRGTRGVDAVTDAYDHICIDEFDYVGKSVFTRIVDEVRRLHGTSISVAGTATPSGRNADRILGSSEKDPLGAWEITWDSPRSCELTNDEYVKDWADSMPAVSEVTEVDGMIVTDPREYADHVPEESDD